MHFFNVLNISVNRLVIAVENSSFILLSGFYDFLNDESLTNSKIDAQKDLIIKQGAGLYRTYYIVGILAILCGGMAAFCSLAMYKHSFKRFENKEWVKYVIIGVVGFFSAASLVTGVLSIGSAIKYT